MQRANCDAREDRALRHATTRAFDLDSLVASEWSDRGQSVHTIAKPATLPSWLLKRMLKQIYRSINGVLNTLGFRLERTSNDLSARLTEDDSQELARRLATTFREWMSVQTVFPKLRAFDVESETIRFYEAYLASPFRERSGGSRLNNALFLFLVAQAIAPDVIIDSGTYKGASAWALALACPDAKIYSFDIDLSHLLERQSSVNYVQSDWATHDFSGVDLSRALCYFDDHVDQVKRLLEASERGVPFAVFDDDFPITSFAEMAHGGLSLPKIEFLLDPYVQKKDVIRWIDRERTFSWTVNREYLARGRAVIIATDRLPNTSLITGIHQTPYRLVALSAKSP